jgi:hypothetical protein
MRRRIAAVLAITTLAGGGWTILKPEPLYSSDTCRSNDGHTCDYVCRCTFYDEDGGCLTYVCDSYYRW